MRVLSSAIGIAKNVISNPRSNLAVSAVLISLSAFLLFAHASAVRDMREMGLPAAVRLSDMRERQEILAAQQEIAELQASLYGRADEEYVRLYVLPAEPEMDRLVALFDQFFSTLHTKGGMIGSPALTIGDTIVDTSMSGATITPVSFTADLTTSGLTDTLALFRLSGLLSVADTLSREHIDQLLTLTEQERPDTVSALEHFLSLDLLRYAEKPSAYRDQLFAAFETPGASDMVEAILRDSAMPTTEAFLAQYGAMLRKGSLWPTRFLTVESATVEQVGEHMQLTVTVNAHGRIE